MGQMKEIKNDGQFDSFVQGIISDLNSVMDKIRESDYVPEGMNEVLDGLIDVRLSIELCLSTEEILKMY